MDLEGLTCEDTCETFIVVQNEFSDLHLEDKTKLGEGEILLDPPAPRSQKKKTKCVYSRRNKITPNLPLLMQPASRMQMRVARLL